MKPEDFNPQDYLPQGCYPWPDLINPNIAQMEIDMNNWIDHDYTYLSEKARRKYKKMGFHLCTARMIPKASYEQTIPCNRFVLNFVVMDDQMEFATIEEKKKTVIGQ
jgi:predicted metal-dependent phosphoesterase TrpH